MDSDRKYKQPGYQDSGSQGQGNGTHKPAAPRQVGEGPRLPRMVQSVAASRCYNCSSTLPAGYDFLTACPKCGSDLHCCKQCAHFDPATRFQCRKPVPERIPYKDKRNECQLFAPQVTVARDSPLPQPGPMPTIPPGIGTPQPPPKRTTDARSAFEDLFKK